MREEKTIMNEIWSSRFENIPARQDMKFKRKI